MVWTKQVEHSLSWLRAFFVEDKYSISTTFQLVDYLRQGDEVVIGTDASPTRLGGWLMINGVITAFFSDAISTKDEEVYATTSERHEDQQTWEFLAILVALRLWIGISHHKASQGEERQPSTEDHPILAAKMYNLSCAATV